MGAREALKETGYLKSIIDLSTRVQSTLHSIL